MGLHGTLEVLLDAFPQGGSSAGDQPGTTVRCDPGCSKRVLSLDTCRLLGSQGLFGFPA